MASLSNPNVRIVVLISEQTQYGRFDDALRYTEPEFTAKTDAEVDAEAQARVTNWVASVQSAIANPPPAPTLTELETQLAALEAQVAAVEAQIAAI
jgi:hypothetical protein